VQKITTFLWLDDQAEEAANFYVSVFSSRRESDSDPGPSKVVELTRYGEAGPGPREPS
jgi:predicted 3-demethylubiquinone-9 3-methyltransferase (glyoxalase superfamily)